MLGGITPEIIVKWVDERRGKLTQDYVDIVEKYGWSNISDDLKRLKKRPIFIDDFLETLSQTQLNQLYKDLLELGKKIDKKDN
ncbi:MAG TPA: hypothetical protein VFV86_08430 [Nitrososphaeraceae archaeon]|nr:hypothetical protein [Nitrososphaeraceae archaeon]